MNENMSCRNLIRQINDTLEKKVNNTLRGLGLTLAQLNLLSELDNAKDGALSLRELQDLLGVAQSTATGLVSRLVTKGLVDVLVDPGDRRIHIVQLTEQGAKDCAKRRQTLLRTEEMLLKSLTDEERQQLLRLLRKVFETL
jgi:DNA-binding MarR family transcriptional regulator